MAQIMQDHVAGYSDSDIPSCLFILVVIMQSKIMGNSYLNVIAVLYILYSNSHEHNQALGLTESY